LKKNLGNTDLFKQCTDLFKQNTFLSNDEHGNSIVMTKQ